MTVRAWFTISALVIAGLAVAFAVRFFSDVQAPAVAVRTGDVRLIGRPVSSCWPQRSGTVECTTHGPGGALRSTRIPAEGTFRIVLLYPVQPKEGSVTISQTNGSPRTVVRRDWTGTLRYAFEPGSYVLHAVAELPGDARVTYDFVFSVTRSGD